MLRRGRTTTFPERLDITERAAAGQSDPEIAAALRCSVWTVRTWRRRGQHQGRTGLSSQMGHPTIGLLSTFPRECVMSSYRGTGRIQAGDPRLYWRNCVLIPAGQSTPCQVALA